MVGCVEKKSEEMLQDRFMRVLSYCESLNHAFLIGRSSAPGGTGTFTVGMVSRERKLPMFVASSGAKDFFGSPGTKSGIPGIYLSANFSLLAVAWMAVRYDRNSKLFFAVMAMRSNYHHVMA